MNRFGLNAEAAARLRQELLESPASDLPLAVMGIWTGIPDGFEEAVFESISLRSAVHSLAMRMSQDYLDRFRYDFGSFKFWETVCRIPPREANVDELTDPASLFDAVGEEVKVDVYATSNDDLSAVESLLGGFGLRLSDFFRSDTDVNDLPPGLHFTILDREADPLQASHLYKSAIGDLSETQHDPFIFLRTPMLTSVGHENDEVASMDAEADAVEDQSPTSMEEIPAEEPDVDSASAKQEQNDDAVAPTLEETVAAKVRADETPDAETEWIFGFFTPNYRRTIAEWIRGSLEDAKQEGESPTASPQTGLDRKTEEVIEKVRAMQRMPREEITLSVFDKHVPQLKECECVPALTGLTDADRRKAFRYSLRWTSQELVKAKLDIPVSAFDNAVVPKLGVPDLREKLPSGKPECNVHLAGIDEANRIYRRHPLPPPGRKRPPKGTRYYLDITWQPGECDDQPVPPERADADATCQDDTLADIRSDAEE